jgi:TctA family transporter
MYILKNDDGAAGFGVKIFLLVASILIPYVLVNTLALRKLYLQVAGAVYNEQHLAAVGGGFFSIFLMNGFIGIVVSAVAVIIVFWVVKPWEELGKKIIHTLGKGSPPPPETDKIHYAMDLVDKIDIK